MTTLIRDTRNEPYRLATYLHTERFTLRRLLRKWNRTFPDPIDHWPEMLACVAFVGLMGAVLIAGCVVAGVVQ